MAVKLIGNTPYRLPGDVLDVDLNWWEMFSDNLTELTISSHMDRSESNSSLKLVLTETEHLRTKFFETVYPYVETFDFDSTHFPAEERTPVHEIDKKSIEFDKKTGRLRFLLLMNSSACIAQFNVPTDISGGQFQPGYDYDCFSATNWLYYCWFWHPPSVYTEGKGILVSHRLYVINRAADPIPPGIKKFEIGMQEGTIFKLTWFLFDPKKGFKKVTTKNHIISKLINDCITMEGLT